MVEFEPKPYGLKVSNLHAISLATVLLLGVLVSSNFRVQGKFIGGAGQFAFLFLRLG